MIWYVCIHIFICIHTCIYILSRTEEVAGFQSYFIMTSLMKNAIIVY